MELRHSSSLLSQVVIFAAAATNFGVWSDPGHTSLSTGSESVTVGSSNRHVRVTSDANCSAGQFAIESSSSTNLINTEFSILRQSYSTAHFNEDTSSDILQISKHELPWHSFLARLVTQYPNLSSEHVAYVQILWRKFTIVTGGGLPLPITYPTEEGSIQLAWNKADEYLDIEVFRDRRISWYYRNRIESTSESSGDDPVRVIPNRFFRHLKRFRSPISSS